MPWLSGSENPPRPTLTPQITWPRFFTVSRVEGVWAEAVAKAKAPSMAPATRRRLMTVMGFPLKELRHSYRRTGPFATNKSYFI